MGSVTKRISEVKQPKGGYLKPASFTKIKFNDNKYLSTNENILPTIIGMVVDYLTRFSMGTPREEAFKIAIIGAYKATTLGVKTAHSRAKEYLQNIVDLSDNSIINACKLVTFDVWVRDPKAAIMARDISDMIPNEETIKNIRTLIHRSIAFFNEYGPITQDGFTFEPNGYTKTVDRGDGDFLTNDTLWDFKVSKNEPTSKHTLQILMYWIMGQHSQNHIFNNISNIGIFNPRLNTAYILNVSNIPKDIIETIEREVICY